MPLPHVFDSGSPPAEIARLPQPSRRPDLAALVPRVVLRFSYRGSSTSDAALYDGTADATRWFVPLGVTFEARATWSFDRLLESLPDASDDEAPGDFR